ncbi:hypothetical protein C8R43DRAFT_958765 [Mycena crocata]|nr:hypothetical protein C8R43DRAFT_958765 [Mycena crocata]
MTSSQSQASEWYLKHGKSRGHAEPGGIETAMELRVRPGKREASRAMKERSESGREEASSESSSYLDEHDGLIDCLKLRKTVTKVARQLEVEVARQLEVEATRQLEVESACGLSSWRRMPRLNHCA